VSFSQEATVSTPTEALRPQCTITAAHGREYTGKLTNESLADWGELGIDILDLFNRAATEIGRAHV
jgi:hypothetical protein